MAAQIEAAGQVKVLTIGPPCGKIQELHTKIAAIDAKYGPFDALLCLGDLWTPYDDGAELSQEEAELIQGTRTLPLPLYFALPPSRLHPTVLETIAAKYMANPSVNDDHSRGDIEPTEIASNLFFLGKTGVCKIKGRKGKSALRVAIAGGEWDAQLWQQSTGKTESSIESIASPALTTASVERLLEHPSFHEPSPAALPRAVDDEIHEPSTLADARLRQIQQKDLQKQQANALSRPPVDILLTTAWPAGITMFSSPDKLPHQTSRVWGATVVAKLVRCCTPRYHFALGPGSTGSPDAKDASFGIVGLDGTEDGAQLRQTGVFWEREAFANQGRVHALCSVTRFVSLARFANAKKARWFMALNMSPAGGADTAKSAPKPPANVTPSPFAGDGAYGAGVSSSASSSKRSLEEEDLNSGPNYRWQESKRKQPRTNNGGQGMSKGANGLPSKPNVPMPERPERRVIPVGPQDCWFCLSNPQCAKHLIVAIGTEAYVAMPKGQLPPTTDALSPVPGGGHVLIIPIEHFPSLLGHPDASLAAPIATEMASWRSALAKVYASFQAVPVSWEICRTTGSRAGHMQAQVVPIPRHMLEGIKDYFREAADKREYKMIEQQEEVKRLLSLASTDDNERIAERSDYFRLDIGTDTTWLLLLPRGMRFYLQFPRETLAAYLNMPDRADWRKCARSEAIETAEARAFKAAFDPFAEGVGE